MSLKEQAAITVVKAGTEARPVVYSMIFASAKYQYFSIYIRIACGKLRIRVSPPTHTLPQNN